MTHPSIDPALGLNLVPERTLSRATASVGIAIPAHNEAETIAEVVKQALRSLAILDVSGQVLVSASGCTDDTAERASAAGASVIEAPIGKGAAVKAALETLDADIVCLIDGDVQYFGEPPLAVILVEPILHGIADACITDLYWRPLYPQMWLQGFFAPVAGYMFPELLPKIGSTPWSGQRAARRHLWPSELPDDFTVDLELVMHWNTHALRLRPVLADDWVNPQRPKDDLMRLELELLIRHGISGGRITEDGAEGLRRWHDATHRLMAAYRPGADDPQEFERRLLLASREALLAEMCMGNPDGSLGQPRLGPSK